MKKRERFLTPEERQRVQAVIDARASRSSAGRKGHLHIASVWAFDLLALTGRRRNEIVLLKWEMVDWQHAFLDLPDTKGGQLKIPVSKHVLGLLKYIHDQTGNPRYGLRAARAEGDADQEHQPHLGEHPRRRRDPRRPPARPAALVRQRRAHVRGPAGRGRRDARPQARPHDAALRPPGEPRRPRGLEAATDRIVAARARGAPRSRRRRSSASPTGSGSGSPAIDRGDARHLRGKRTDLRRTVDAIRWVLHNGAKWREMPKNLGPATTCWRWYERWCANGTWGTRKPACHDASSPLETPPALVLLELRELGLIGPHTLLELRVLPLEGLDDRFAIVLLLSLVSFGIVFVFFGLVFFGLVFFVFVFFGSSFFGLVLLRPRPSSASSFFGLVLLRPRPSSASSSSTSSSSASASSTARTRPNCDSAPSAVTRRSSVARVGFGSGSLNRVLSCGRLTPEERASAETVIPLSRARAARCATTAPGVLPRTPSSCAPAPLARSR
jgi:transposase